MTQDWVGWLGDVAKGIAIEAVIVGAGGALLVFAMRRFGRHWWAPATAVVVAFGVFMTYASPILIEPLFNTFKPLPPGELRSDVLELADEAGVKVGEVYEMDASRRTTAANAYVAGLGSTKRVVLYDTLLRDFSEDEVRLVVAHELGHVHYDDVPRGLLYLAIVAPFGMFAVARLSERLAPAGGPAAVPAVALSLALLAPAITTISNQLSREVEARADRFSLELTDAPDALIGFQQRIAVQNVSDPEPPELGARSCSARTRRRWSGSARRWPSRIRRRLELREVLDVALGLPLGPVVLHRVDQLAHEARRDADARDHHAGDLLALHLVIHARERDRELVVRVRDVREVRVDPGHHLRRGVEVDVALGLIAVHAP